MRARGQRAWSRPLDDIEAIAGHAPTAEVVVRIAGLARAGRVEAFRRVVAADAELDDETRRWVLRLTEDEGVLLAAGIFLEHARRTN